MLVLSEADVNTLLTMEEAIEVLRAAFTAQDTKQATNRPRERVRTPQGVTLHMLGAALYSEDVIGFKAYTSSAKGTRFMVMLYSASTGETLALLEADRLGQIRTGAASGLATDLLARPDAKTVGIYGSGYQAETQLEAVCAVRPIKAVMVYSRDEAKRSSYAAKMSERLKVEVRPVERPEEAAQADIVTTATTARQPVLMGQWLREGTHINASGANMLLRRELDDEAVQRAATVAVDSKDQALKEASDLTSPLERGFITFESLIELREIASGARQGRANTGDITLFKSLGVGLEDVAAAAFVYRKAHEKGLGTELNFNSK